MSIIDTIDRLARTFILPLNDKLTDVEVWESVIAHDTFVVQFVYVGDLTPKEKGPPATEGQTEQRYGNSNTESRSCQAGG